jgi:hypothetical protein
VKTDNKTDKTMEVRHLLRTVKTALELAIIGRAPMDILNRLARPAGLLEAVSQLPADGGAVDALLPDLLPEAQSAVARWEAWVKVRAPAA